jgi:hypothetical protein
VYLFANEFAKTPASQLISGVAPVTEGLVLRITTEGLFIDDDVRGVPQREWDVKAWTLKSTEVWCPHHCLNPATQAHLQAQQQQQQPSSPVGGGGRSSSQGGFLHKLASQTRAARDRERNAGPPVFVGDDADAYLADLLRVCRECCRVGLAAEAFLMHPEAAAAAAAGENGWRDKSLHVLRATVRDQDGKRYLFVVPEEESWKLAHGLHRLRRGTQVRSLGVGGFGVADARNTLETLGW